MIRSSSVRERLWHFGGSGFVESGQTAQRWTPNGFSGGHSVFIAQLA